MIKLRINQSGPLYYKGFMIKLHIPVPKPGHEAIDIREAIGILTSMVSQGLNWETDLTDATSTEELAWTRAEVIVRATLAVDAGRPIFVVTCNGVESRADVGFGNLEDWLCSLPPARVVHDDLRGLCIVEQLPSGLKRSQEAS